MDACMILGWLTKLENPTALIPNPKQSDITYIQCAMSF